MKQRKPRNSKYRPSEATQIVVKRSDCGQNIEEGGTWDGDQKRVAGDLQAGTLEEVVGCLRREGRGRGHDKEVNYYYGLGTRVGWRGKERDKSQEREKREIASSRLGPQGEVEPQRELTDEYGSRIGFLGGARWNWGTRNTTGISRWI